MVTIPAFRHSRSWWSLDLELAVAAWLPLLARTRWPVPVAALAACLDAVRIAVAAHGSAAADLLPLATMLALYTVATHRPARVAWTAGATAATVQMTVAAASGASVKSVALYVNWALVATAVGRLLAERRERIAAAEARAAAAEAGNAAEARRQVTAERIRIAHELHDVLAHHIAVVNAQAGVAQFLLRTDPNAAETALAGIVDNTRAALDDLRATLGVLRAEPNSDAEPDPADLGDRRPTPRADQLPAMLERYRQAGVPLTVTVSGEPRALASTADLALYRITQEALTNATKHAPGSAVLVELAWSDATVTVTITNTAPVDAAVAAAGTGNGLLGMRERAAAAAGTFETSLLGAGGWRVRACLPAPADGLRRHEGRPQ